MKIHLALAAWVLTFAACSGTPAPRSPSDSQPIQADGATVFVLGVSCPN